MKAIKGRYASSTNKLSSHCIYVSLRNTLHPTSFASYALIICKLQNVGYLLTLHSPYIYPTSCSKRHHDRQTKKPKTASPSLEDAAKLHQNLPLPNFSPRSVLKEMVLKGKSRLLRGKLRGKKTLFHLRWINLPVHIWGSLLTSISFIRGCSCINIIKRQIFVK